MARPKRTVEVDRDEVRIQQFKLTVTGGPDRGREATSTGTEMSIGAAEGNVLALTDPTVSRHHCVVSATSVGFHVRDLGSTNGTRIGSVRIDGGFVKHRGTIAAGETTLRFEVLDTTIVEPLSTADRFGSTLGKSHAMRRLFAILPRLAAAEATVMIEGETGTGKTALAEAIHRASPRAAGPFVVLDCSAIPPTLVESELFGHEKGAFTGAHAARPGAFEAARGGTVFLDEIGELPLDMQPKLLRALEERTVKRIGSAESIKLDVRLIAATNRDLPHEVNRGRFRSDLFYRLATVRLRVPPLRERRDDILLLANHFFEQFAPDQTMPPELATQLAAQDWPGNVRELRSAIERAVLMDDPELWRELNASPVSPVSPVSIDAKPTTPAIPAGNGPSWDAGDATQAFRVAKERATARWERWFLAELVARNAGNLSAAAREARMDRTHLRDLLRRHGIRAD